MPYTFYLTPHMKLHESNVIFVNFHTLLQSKDFVVVLVLVLVPRLL